jgi:bacterioferritin-associated ferredoxin
MNDIEQPICFCTGTTAAKIQQLITDNVVNTLEDIINYTGATTGCAGCEYDVAKFVEQQLSSGDAK